MPKGQISTGEQPLRETEDAAYNAFREWHVFLVLRKKELEAHHAPAAVDSIPAESLALAKPPVEPPVQAKLPTTAPALPAKAVKASPRIPQAGAKPTAPASSNDAEIQLPLTSIEWSGGTQARVKGVNPAVVSEYAARMRDGERPPAIVVFYDGEKYWPADGFHRGAAAHMVGERTIAAQVRRGSRQEAILYGISANKGHGLRYSNEDKRNAIRLILLMVQDLGDVEAGKKWSDREIARHCGVDHKTVGAVRKELASQSQPIQQNAARRKATVTS